MKEYRNYNDQVTQNVKNLRLTDLDDSSNMEFYEKLYYLKYEMLTIEKELELSIESGIELFTDELSEYISDYIYESIESIYVTYQVDLIGDYNQEHKRLEIVYIDGIDAYVMPVYAFGISWNMLGVLN